MSDSLNDYIDERIQLTLGLYRHKIKQVNVFLTDINGPKGNKDTRCIIHINVNRASPFVTQETAEDMYYAINVCSQRAKRAVNRRFNRVRQK